MSEIKLPPEFESNLRRAMDVPAPGAVFVARLRSQLEQEVQNMKSKNGVQSLPTLRRSQETSDSGIRLLFPPTLVASPDGSRA